MIQIKSTLDCCGCSACVEICPQKCITFEDDSEGFWYPVVEEDRCIECGLCEKVCPIKNHDEERTPQKVYAGKNKNEEIRKDSASGGVFSIIAHEIIKKGGVVFGVKFNDQWDVVFDYTDSLEGLEAFRKSKYVQAWVGDSFLRVQECLKSGRLVLFSGTPCQIAGLRHFLRKEYENLLLVDLICEGVPSPKVWKKYLKEELIAQKKKTQINPEENVIIKDISFRNKNEGWKKFSFSISLAKVSADGKFINDLPIYVDRDSAYMRALFTCLDLRPICHSCPFKFCKSHSDITIADYWGINELHPEMDDDLGTSMIYVHTKKGDKYLDLSKIDYIETSYEEAFKYNNILSSTPINPRRNLFFSYIERRSVIKTINVFSLISMPHYYMRVYIKRLLGKRIVGVIKKYTTINL